jgi:hypothetical protein
MNAARPHRARPRQAPPVRCARRQLAQRPRRWRRLLAMGLALVLVAAVVPGAHAGDDGGGVPISPQSVGNQALDDEMFDETLAQKFDAETPVVSDGDDDGGGDGSSDQVALAPGGEATGSEGSAIGGEDPQPSAPSVVEEHPEAPIVAQAQPDHADEQPAEGKDQAGQDEQRGSGSGGCASSCSTQPPNPGGPTVAAAGSWWGRGFLDRLAQRFGRGQPPQQAQEPARQELQESAQPPRRPARPAPHTLAELAQVVETVETGLREAESRIRTWDEMQRDGERIHQARRYLVLGNRLGELYDEQSEPLWRDLVRRTLAADRQSFDERWAYDNASTPIHMAGRDLDSAESLAREAQAHQSQADNPYVSLAQWYLNQVDERIRELGPQAELSEIERLRLEDLKGRSEAVRQRLPSQHPMSMPDDATRELVTGNLEDIPPQINTSIPPTPAIPPQDRDQVSGNLGHTTPKIDTRIPPTPAVPPPGASAGTLAATKTEAPVDYVATSLTVALAGLLAFLCKGPTCGLSTLGPNLRRLDPAFRGFPMTPVPGDLQG